MPTGSGPPSIASCVPSGDHVGKAPPPGKLVICCTSVPSSAEVKTWSFPATVRVKAILPLNFAAGITGLDGADGGPTPTLLVASTVNVYAVLFVKPATVAEVCEPGTVTVAPPGDAVTL